MLTTENTEDTEKTRIMKDRYHRGDAKSAKKNHGIASRGKARMLFIKRWSEATSTNIQYKIYNIQSLTLAAKMVKAKTKEIAKGIIKPALAAITSYGVSRWMRKKNLATESTESTEKQGKLMLSLREVTYSIVFKGETLLQKDWGYSLLSP